MEVLNQITGGLCIYVSFKLGRVMWVIGERVGKNIGDCKCVWSSLRCPSIGSHRWLYLGGGVGVCSRVSSDEDWVLMGSVDV